MVQCLWLELVLGLGLGLAITGKSLDLTLLVKPWSPYKSPSQLFVVGYSRDKVVPKIVTKSSLYTCVIINKTYLEYR